jgi:hypothetical protein
MDLDSFIDQANKIKADRLKEPYQAIVGSRAADLLEASARVARSREARMEAPKPIDVKKFAHCPKAFVCKDLFNKEISVAPTLHALEQFSRRYPYVDPYWKAGDWTDVENKMREVFNNCHHRTNMTYIQRNAKHIGGKSTIAWGNDKINFIVNSFTLTIITAELCGDLMQFNKSAYVR